MTPETREAYRKWLHASAEWFELQLQGPIPPAHTAKHPINTKVIKQDMAEQSTQLPIEGPFSKVLENHDAETRRP